MHPYLIILSSARSGSNWMRGLVQSSKQTKVYGELAKSDYFQKDRGAVAFAKDLDLDYQQLSNEFGATPEALVEQARAACIESSLLFGCKIFYYHVSASPWASSLVLSQDSRVIHLYRNRLFDTFTSLQLARRTGSWHGIAYSDGLQLDFVESEYRRFRSDARDQFFQWRDALMRQKSLDTVLELEYSIVGTESALTQVQAFLGLSDLALPKLPKQSQQPALSYWKQPELAEKYVDDRLCTV